MFFLNTAYQQERHLQVYGEAHWEILLSKCFKCMIIFNLLNEILINPEKMLKIFIVGDHLFSTSWVFPSTLSYHRFCVPN